MRTTASISTVSGGNFENLVPSTVPAVTQVTDTIDTFVGSGIRLTSGRTLEADGQRFRVVGVVPDVRPEPARSRPRKRVPSSRRRNPG